MFARILVPFALLTLLNPLIADDPPPPVPAPGCCTPADVEDGPEQWGCHATCENPVPRGDAACFRVGEKSSPYIHQGGCEVSTDPELECADYDCEQVEPYYVCRWHYCDGYPGKGMCQWEVFDTKKIEYTDCQGDACYGSGQTGPACNK